MSDQAKGKRCCDRPYPIECLYCDVCGDALEDRHYLRWIFVTIAAAIAIEWGLTRTNVLVKFRWSEVFTLEVFLLQVLYPLAKLIQKIRDPHRPVLREMATVFADRTVRVVLIAAWTYIALLFANVVPGIGVIGGANLVDPTHLPIRRIFLNVSLIGSAVVSVLVLVSQGPRFFDLRIGNTLKLR